MKSQPVHHVQNTAEAPTSPEEFTSYVGLLWRTLAGLARRGHYVPPDEGRDVIHDFYVEAWEGVLRRYEPEKAKFSTYLVGAFMRFAMRRLGQMQEVRSQLVDFTSELGLPSDMRGPEEQLDTAQQVERVRNALNKLPGLQRQLLLAYVAAEGATERELAARMAKSRHSVRQELARGLAALAKSYVEGGVHESDARILEMAWEEGRVSGDIAARIGVPTQIVRLKREQVAQQTLRLLRESIHGRASKSEVEMDYGELFRHAALSNDRAGAQAAVRQHADELRTYLASEKAAEVYWSPGDEEALRAQPDRLAEVYELLYATQDAYEDDVSRTVDTFLRDRTTELYFAFEEMCVLLPSDLTYWGGYFSYRSSSKEASWLLSKHPYGEAGLAAQQLAIFGLTPETFAQSWGGFALLFEEPDFERDFALNGKQVLVREDNRPHSSPLYLEDLVLTAQETPGIPDEQAAEGMARWTLDALRLLPFLVPGFRVRTETDVPVVEPYTAELSLSARLTARAVEPKLRARERGFRFS